MKFIFRADSDKESVKWRNQDLNSATDHQLMLAVRDGDIDKLGLLFDNYHKQLYNFFLKQIGNRQLSEDFVQEVFLRMLKYRHTYRGEGKFTTWMFQIAHNIQIDFFKKQRDETSLEDDSQFISTELNPQDMMEQKNEIVLLKKALARLAPDKREILVLSRFHDFTYTQIGEMLGIKVGTIKALVFRVLKELSEIYHELAGEDAL